ncbi:MAG: PilZ domain-containing protein [Phycisphaerae bacterium]|nr:PilZ domain-containing protein [Phycisphaerae bacterium]
MLVALDLTARQAARVLAQALQTHAKLEIEPRPEYFESPLWGRLESRVQDLLIVHLVDAGREFPLAALIGAMCDVRTIMSGQFYMFTTVIVDTGEGTAPRRLCLAVPDAIQVANRRRHTRKNPIEPVPVRLTLPGVGEPFVGHLANIGRGGLGCRVLQRELDELLLIGNEVRLEFMLPWMSRVYSLPSEVCSKTLSHDKDHLLVGFEFCAPDAAAQATLELLRSVLDNETQRLTEIDGEPL